MQKMKMEQLENRYEGFKVLFNQFGYYYVLVGARVHVWVQMGENKFGFIDSRDRDEMNHMVECIHLELAD